MESHHPVLFLDATLSLALSFQITFSGPMFAMFPMGKIENATEIITENAETP